MQLLAAAAQSSQYTEKIYFNLVKTLIQLTEFDEARLYLGKLTSLRSADDSPVDSKVECLRIELLFEVCAHLACSIGLARSCLTYF